MMMMMKISVVMQAASLLLLLAAISCEVAPGPEDCSGVKDPLLDKDVHKVFGHWILVYGVGNNSDASELLANLSSSFVDMELNPDNKTFEYDERNLFSDGSCSKYYMNVTIHDERLDSDHHGMRTNGGIFEKNGVRTVYNDSAVVHFYQTDVNCMMMDYHGAAGDFLLLYRRDGHMDIELMKAHHSHHEKIAKCLGFPIDNAFVYDGVAAFCPKTEATAAPDQS